MATRRLMRFVFAIVTTAVITSCNIAGKHNPNGAKGVAESFSREYFNLRYKNAAKYCTKGSEQWLKFAASQISGEDIETLRTANDEAEVKIEKEDGDDRHSTVTVIVSNYFEADTIGRSGHFNDKGTFRLSLVKEGKAWKVRMEGLPRNERQSRG